jgi:hypothetical protein
MSIDFISPGTIDYKTLRHKSVASAMPLDLQMQHTTPPTPLMCSAEHAKPFGSVVRTGISYRTRFNLGLKFLVLLYRYSWALHSDLLIGLERMAIHRQTRREMAGPILGKFDKMSTQNQPHITCLRY